MNKTIWSAVVGVVFCMSVACGDDSLRQVFDGDGTRAPAEPAVSETGSSGPTVWSVLGGRTEAPPVLELEAESAPAANEADVKIRGDNIADLTGFFVVMGDVRVFADGVELDVYAPTRSILDLTRTDHAYRLGRFVIPEGAQLFTFVVEIDDFGGYESDASAGYVDARGSVITFEVPVTALQLHNHAVLHLDLARSLQEVRAGEQFLLPRLTVRH
jgi:hypothetical protein